MNLVDAQNFEFKLNSIEGVADSSPVTMDSFVGNKLKITGLCVNGTK